jgi:hypothetical protein
MNQPLIHAEKAALIMSAISTFACAATTLDKVASGRSA